MVIHVNVFYWGNSNKYSRSKTKMALFSVGLKI